MEPKVGTLLWSKREQVGPVKQDAWYDRYTYRVPVVGTVDSNKIHNALQRKFQDRAGGLWGSAVGGFCSVASVKDNGDGTVMVEQFYHIGD